MAEQPQSRDPQAQDGSRRAARRWTEEARPENDRAKESFLPTVPTVVEEGFDSPEWVFQIVEEGVPLLVVRDEDGASLRDRRGRNLARFFPELIDALLALPAGTTLDADVVCRKARSEPHDRQFLSDEAIQRNAAALPCLLIVHDLLEWNGQSRTTASTGIRRRELLEAAASFDERFMIAAELIEGAGTEAVRIACENGHRSVRAKMKGSPYPGRETRVWREIPCNELQLLVVGGYIDPDFDNRGMLRLLTGAFDRGRFAFQKRATVPSAMKERVLDAIRPLTRGQHPFHENPGWLPGLHWVSPELVVQLEGSRVERIRPDLSAETIHPRTVERVRRGSRRTRANDQLRMQKRLRFSA